MQVSARDDWSFVLARGDAARANGQAPVPPRSEAGGSASLMSLGDGDTLSLASNVSIASKRDSKAAAAPMSPGSRASALQRSQV